MISVCILYAYSPVRNLVNSISLSWRLPKDVDSLCLISVRNVDAFELFNADRTDLPHMPRTCLSTSW